MKWEFSVLTVMVSYDGQTVDGLFHSMWRFVVPVSRDG